MSNKRDIFVGSSSEAELVANEVVGQVIKDAEMEPVLWRTIFTAGTYPLEVFEENLPKEVIGAVLLATPDEFGKRGDASFDAPVANVILEYGYLAARLGRSRVAICEFDDVILPSDLAGLTNIKSGKYEKDGQSPLPEYAKTQLRAWLENLLHLAEEIPPIRQLHGYSGKWKVQSYFSRWRGRPVGPNEEVTFNGSTFLFVEVGGKRVSGIQMGVLTVKLDGGFRETRKIFNEVVGGSFNESGDLEIEVKVRHRDLMRESEGKAPDDLGEDWLKNLEEAPSFNIRLEPVPGKSKYLHGTHFFKPGKTPHQQAEEEWHYSDL